MLCLADEAAGDAAALAVAEGEADAFCVICALSDRERAKLTTHMALARIILLFMTSPILLPNFRIASTLSKWRADAISLIRQPD